MRTACLAWGSPVWKPGPLSPASSRHDDGPPLPIAFVREADGGELATTAYRAAVEQRFGWTPVAAPGS